MPQLRNLHQLANLTSDRRGARPFLPFEITSEPWMERGLCREAGDPDSFFQDTVTTADQFVAKKICKLCEVRPECLSYALRANEQYGIWGGMSRTQREKLQADRQSG